MANLTAEQNERIKQFNVFMKDAFNHWAASDEGQAVTKRGMSPSQKAFCDFLKVSDAAYSNWRSGNRFPSIYEARKMAKAVGVKIYDILGYPAEMPPNPTLNELVKIASELSNEKQIDLLNIAIKMTNDNET